jgi:hypothetical protein
MEENMKKIVKNSMVILVTVALISIPFGTSALAESTYKKGDISAGAMAADILFARPVGILAVVTGSVLFVVALPFSALGGNVQATSQKLVKDPVKFTFYRPLGDL